MMQQRDKQSGFTLIELIVVVSILGVLAAVALPRFANVSDKAHNASVRAAGGGLATAVLLARAQWLANGHSGEVDDLQNFGEDNVSTNDVGWPVSTNGNNGTPNGNRCVQIWEGVFQGSAPTVSTSAATENLDYLVAAGPATGECTYTYQLDVSTNTIVYNSNNGKVVTTIN